MGGTLGDPIPENTQHAVSVSLPTWKSNVGYEEGQEWVISKMKTGYPRFFIHKSIQKLADSVLQKYGHSGENAMLFPSARIGPCCRQFIKKFSTTTPSPTIRVVDLISLVPKVVKPGEKASIWSDLCVVFFPAAEVKIARQFWQHTGEGISSRRAEFCQREFDDGLLVERSEHGESFDSGGGRIPKGPKRYSRRSPDNTLPQSSHHSEPNGLNGNEEVQPTSTFVEERFGRNLDISFVGSAKLAMRRRIADVFKSNVDLHDAMSLPGEGEGLVGGFSERDVYLYPSGMSAIFNAYRLLTGSLGPKKSISYGFPYVDTLKILEKFGPGCHLYGYGSQEELDDLEGRLKGGESILALFCEFPGNPLLRSPNLQRIRCLADKYKFAVVVDQTIGTSVNVHVLPFADIVVDSLTKVFSGDSNVMGGSLVLNPKGQFYRQLNDAIDTDYEDNYWADDALFMERNSRDFVSRVKRINTNAEAVCDVLKKHPRVKEVHYPKYGPTKQYYDSCRCPNGGYGGLLSVIFFSQEDAVVFFDTLETAKGPSLGTNFTLSSPYTLLAHYLELEWAAQYGLQSDLVRFSVGLEETGELVGIIERALDALD